MFWYTEHVGNLSFGLVDHMHLFQERSAIVYLARLEIDDLFPIP